MQKIQIGLSMIIERPTYMHALEEGIGTDQVKIVTGVRRSGKSYLLFKLFKEHLLEGGVPEENIFEMAFDQYRNRAYRDSETFYSLARGRLEAMSGKRFVLLDEVQLLEDFPEVLIDFISMRDVDVFVTGSNARLLSKDVVTEFRGRGWEIRLAPLSFSEFLSARGGEPRDAFGEYATYGGLPAVLSKRTAEEKARYLTSLYDELYLRDIVERNGVRDAGNLEALVDVLSSGVGSLTNASKLAATFRSDRQVTIAPETIDRYLGHLEDAFLVTRAKRFDVKGRRYIGTPYKFYFCDVGLRNARMNFRQVEENHIMENVIFNELSCRGFGVDVGVVPIAARDADGRVRRSQLEIDFVCNKGSRRAYVQSAFALPTPEKREREERPLMKVGDAFKKVIITRDGPPPHYTADGILMMNVFDFLMDADSLDF